MKDNNENKVCPVEYAGALENPLRKWLTNLSKVLKPFIKDGMTAIDLGCGPGVFTIEMAKLAGEAGKVIAVDIQKGMLDRLQSKICGTTYESRITLHLSESEQIGINEPADFVLAFFMIHEVPDHRKMFAELKHILKPGGTMLIVEPKFHVTKRKFQEMMDHLAQTGWEIKEHSSNLLSRKTVIINTK